MKKFLLVAAIAVFGMGLTNAQDSGFSAGVNAGLPIGDFADFYTFTVGVEANYLFPVSDQFLVGGSVGVTNFFGDSGEEEVPFFGTVEFEVEDALFIPVVAKAVYTFGDSGFGVAADLGYAIGTGDNLEGGLLYEPQVVFNTEMMMFSLGYQGISNDGDSLNSIQLGAAYKF